MKLTAESARLKKCGYMRSAKLSKNMNCSLRANDARRALYYRKMQYELNESN